jgi:DNA-binding transcriptional MerR regulator
VLIGELSGRTGVSRRSLRYYEAHGLLCADRGANGYRRYGPDAVRTVRMIRGLLAAGLSTDVIRSVLPCATGDDTPELQLCPELVQRLRRELAQMDAQLAALQKARGTLAGYLPTGQPAQ